MGVEPGCIDMQTLERLRILGGSELLSDMVELFISHADPLLRDAATAMENENLDEVGRAAHSLKSSAGNLGAFQVQEIAERIEQLAEAGRMLEMKPLLTDLENAYARAKNQLVGETR